MDHTRTMIGDTYCLLIHVGIHVKLSITLLKSSAFTRFISKVTSLNTSALDYQTQFYLLFGQLVATMNAYYAGVTILCDWYSILLTWMIKLVCTTM